jgi:hypothetical protein
MELNTSMPDQIRSQAELIAAFANNTSGNITPQNARDFITTVEPDALRSHLAPDTSNPHQVTAAQVGAYTTSQADSLLAAKAGASTVTNHIAATGTAVHGLGTASIHAASDFDSAGAAATVQTSLNTHITATVAHGTTGNVVGTNDTQTITNKTISGSSNTITNLNASNLTTGTINAARLPNLSTIYLPIGGGSMTGTLNLSGNNINLNNGSGSTGGGTINIDGGTLNMAAGGGGGGGTFNVDNGTIQNVGLLSMTPGSGSSISMNGQTLNMNNGGVSGGGTINMEAGTITNVGVLNMGNGPITAVSTLSFQSGFGFSFSGFGTTSTGQHWMEGNALCMNTGAGTGGGSLNMDSGGIFNANGIGLTNGSGGGSGLSCPADGILQAGAFTLSGLSGGSLTFPDTTIQTTADLPLSGGSLSGNVTLGLNQLIFGSTSNAIQQGGNGSGLYITFDGSSSVHSDNSGNIVWTAASMDCSGIFGPVTFNAINAAVIQTGGGGIGTSVNFGSNVDLQSFNLNMNNGSGTGGASFSMDGGTISNVGSIAVAGALADGTYPCGTGSITILNGAISAIS